MENMSVVVAVIAVVLAIFLLIREFWCWYFKVNKVLEQVEIIALRLETLNIQIETQEILLSRIRDELSQSVRR